MTSERKFKLVCCLAVVLAVSMPVVTIIKSFRLEEDLKVLWFVVWVIHPTTTLSWLFYGVLTGCVALWLHARHKRLDTQANSYGWGIVIALAAYSAAGILFYPIMMAAMLNPLFAAGDMVYTNGLISLSVLAVIIAVLSLRALHVTDKLKARQESRRTLSRFKAELEQLNTLDDIPTKAWLDKS